MEAVVERLQKQVDSNTETGNFNTKMLAAVAKVSKSRCSWYDNLIHPFTTSYRKAFKNFEKQLNILEKDRQKKIEAAFLALSLCGGSVFTAALGGLTLSKIAGNQALTFICNRNMQKTFNMLDSVQGSSVEKFLLGPVADQIKALAGVNFKDAFTKLNNQKNGFLFTEPADVVDSMVRFNTAAEGAVWGALLDLTEDMNIRTEDKGKPLQEILNSPYCRAPSCPVWFDEQLLTDKMELSFYLKMVLDSDYLFYQEPGGTMYQNISALPNGGEYPPHHANGAHGRTTVLFRDIGDNIVKKINELYRKPDVVKHGGNSHDLVQDGFFYNGTTYQGIKKVEAVLDQLGDLSRIKASSSAGSYVALNA